MNKINVDIPEGTGYLSNLVNFKDYLPQEKAIINKAICGCGCTNYFLQLQDTPVLLISPRKELINSKMKSTRLNGLYYFDRTNYRRVTVAESIEKLEEYLGTTTLPPKILMTYDSAKIVIDHLIRTGRIQNFLIVVDEFTCIFSDVRFKGFVEINFLKSILALNNIIYFISATPIKEVFLDMLDEFKNLPYVTLNWPQSSIETVYFDWNTMNSTRAAVKEIINNFKIEGFFHSKVVNGEVVKSIEAVFYVNSVIDIAAIINDMDGYLNPSNTMIICAEDTKNKKRLREVGFKIGQPYNEIDYKTMNKTFTFVTRASFEGTDFYSDNSSTYVFADSNRENMCLDISIDLPQIVGRCRTIENPFRNDITYYFKTTTDRGNVDDLTELVKKKRLETIERIKDFNELKANGKEEFHNFLMKRFINATEKYEDCYVDGLVTYDPDGQITNISAEFNKLAYVADLRSIEIKKNQYKNRYSVLASLDENGFFNENQRQGSLCSVLDKFKSLRKFERRIKIYSLIAEKDNKIREMLEGCSAIPINYKIYSRNMNLREMKAVRFREIDIKRRVDYLQSQEAIKEELLKVLVPGQFYSYGEIKDLLMQVINKLGLSGKPSGSDILLMLPPDKIKEISKRRGKNVYKGIILAE